MSNKNITEKMAGYCALCRREELEKYDELVGDYEELHRQACLEAGCLHPAYYDYSELPSIMRCLGKKRWKKE